MDAFSNKLFEAMEKEKKNLAFLVQSMQQLVELGQYEFAKNEHEKNEKSKKAFLKKYINFGKKIGRDEIIKIKQEHDKRPLSEYEILLEGEKIASWVDHFDYEGKYCPSDTLLPWGSLTTEQQKQIEISNISRLNNAIINHDSLSIYFNHTLEIFDLSMIVSFTDEEMEIETRYSQLWPDVKLMVTNNDILQNEPILQSKIQKRKAGQRSKPPNIPLTLSRFELLKLLESFKINNAIPDMTNIKVASLLGTIMGDFITDDRKHLSKKLNIQQKKNITDVLKEIITHINK